jgi:hypothetical protein
MTRCPIHIHTLRVAVCVMTVLIFIGSVFSPRQSQAATFDHRYSAYTRVLKNYVKDGWVQYRKLKIGRKDLDVYVHDMATLKNRELQSFSKTQAKAFWINAYNALTLKLIIDHDPVSSIRSIEGAWDKEHFKVAGKKRSLSTIEHKILRKTYADPLVHSVLVCAAKSCPVLENTPFLPNDLKARLENASSRFAKSKTRNHYDTATNTLRASKILEWYGQDFVQNFATKNASKPKQSAVIAFLNSYGSGGIAQDATLQWMDYDWSLNGSW